MKKILLWVIWIGVTIVIVYYARGYSFRLFWLDMKSGFQYAPEILQKIKVLVAVTLVAALMIRTVLKGGILTLSWKVSVGGYYTEIKSSRLSYIHFVLLISVSFLMQFGSMFLRDILAERKGEQLEGSLVAHAFGGIDDETYTNSRDALLYNYDLGHRIFEVDFSITSDKKLVCLHDWGTAAKMQGRDKAEILSKDEFESSMIYGRYTPISLSELLLFIAEHEDVWIVTDTKERDPGLVLLEFTYIVDTAKEIGVEDALDRIVV